MYEWASFQLGLMGRRLRCGEVVAYPTEAVWGLGCDPFNSEAVERLLTLKSRPETKGLILIAANGEQLIPLVGNLSSGEWAQMSQPGERPVTWVVPANRYAPAWITGGRETIAVRVTGHPIARGLCLAFGGALVSTSANPQGCPPARTAFKVKHYFGANVALAPGMVGGVARPSEIRDLRSGEVLRPGG